MSDGHSHDDERLLEPTHVAVRPGSSTAAVHGGGSPPHAWPRGTSTPVFQSSTFELDEQAYADIVATGGDETWWYTRLSNPTVDAVANRIAALEGGEDAVAFASGMAAITTAILALTPPGGCVVSARELYGDVFDLLRQTIADAGRTVRFIALDDLDAWRAELVGADTMYVETLSNPMLRLGDLPALAALAREAGAVAIIDNTFTSPINLRPLEHGFDLVVHSATKYLNGHSNLIAGAVVGAADTVKPVRQLAVRLGGCLDPSAASRLDQSLKTLALRVERQNENAAHLARWLESHDEVQAVSYPMLESHPDGQLAQRLLSGGGGMVTFRVRGGDVRSAEVMNGLCLARQATSLGGVETLISAPHNTSHLGLSLQEREAIGILPGTLRLSVGVEDVADLVDDLSQALARTSAPVPADETVP
ncbi:MAG: aminotransferase class I/II-fold pyridoxal phosphate-dependent enzyme [Solirubrobacteraceae bacterium]